MDSLAFQGNATALSGNGLAAVAGSLGVYAPEIWTLLAVETSGCGYLPDRRPLILFERHVFHNLTGGQYDDGDISDPTPGGYGPPGANQFDRLARAIAKDRIAALQSASWGIGQIMGTNFAEAGFQNVEEMVAAMSDSEDNQLTAVGAFLSRTGLGAPLRAHDWASFARGYNGPNYAINRYDIRLNGEFQRYASGVLPDLSVRATQLYLTYLGFHPGGIDGIAGQMTLAALAEFKSNHAVPAGAAATDPNLVAQLLNASTGVSAIAA